MNGSKYYTEDAGSQFTVSGSRALYRRYKPYGNEGSRPVQVIMPE